ncbi:hypothetical protein Ahia01_001008300, partial [Argonauta hians]
PKKESKYEPPRQFKLSHQTLSVTALNFEARSLIGYVELILHPLSTDVYCIKLNSTLCKIYRICIEELWEAEFFYNDPTLEICQGDTKQCNLEFFQRCHLSVMNSIDPDIGNGEILIKLPPGALQLVQELKPLHVCVEFSIEKPDAGIHFVVPNMEGNLAEKAAHMFTYGTENSSRLWFPCIDSYCEPCTWKLEFTVDRLLTAVSCGDLIEVVSTSDRKSKTFHYFLSTPTSAPNIALAVGPFEILVDPNMHEVTHFCLPHLRPIMKNTTGFIHEAFEFFEELMSSRFPYSCYKQVFVDESFVECSPYATMTIFSTSLLHSSRVIDQTLISRHLMAYAVAQQFFGNFITMHSCTDAWLTKGIAGYLTGLFVKRSFGNNEYRYFISKEMKEVADYERHCAIVLDPSALKEPSLLHFAVKSPHLVSPKYADVFFKKAHLVIRILEIRIGYELLLQVFNKLLALAFTASQQKYGSNTWSNMLLSTNSFLKIISTVTGKDIQPYIDQWVCQSGCARFMGNFVFNRKRNVVELEIKQDYAAKGSLKYVGPLTVIIQELDGSFSHNFKIEENKTKFEITCHSKSRRNKKKKIPLMTGEEVDMDLSAMDADSPVLWLRVDPDMTLLRQVAWEQPDYMWQYQLKYERDVVAQCEAIAALVTYPTPATRMALTDTLENEQCFCKVRMEACFCLAKVANAMVSSWAGPPAMMTIFRKMFGSYSCPMIIRQNNFSNFQQYFLLKTIPCAMARLRNIHHICPKDVLKFLLDLFKYNDNSKNKYSDNYYRAALIDALAATVTPAVAAVSLLNTGINVESLSADIRLILEEITRCMNLEKLLPCYRHTVTISCIRAIRVLQKNGHLPSDPQIFESYAEYGIYRDVRLAAFDALVDYISADVNADKLNWLIHLMQTDPDIYVRHKIMEMLVKKPPFLKGDSSPLNTKALVESLWKLITSGIPHDSRLRCGVVDLFHSLYGRTRPSKLPPPDNKDKKPALLNSEALPQLPSSVPPPTNLTVPPPVTTNLSVPPTTTISLSVPPPTTSLSVPPPTTSLSVPPPPSEPPSSVPPTTTTTNLSVPLLLPPSTNLSVQPPPTDLSIPPPPPPPVISSSVGLVAVSPAVASTTISTTITSIITTVASSTTTTAGLAVVTTSSTTTNTKAGSVHILSGNSKIEKPSLVPPALPSEGFHISPPNVDHPRTAATIVKDTYVATKTEKLPAPPAPQPAEPPSAVAVPMITTATRSAPTTTQPSFGAATIRIGEDQKETSESKVPLTTTSVAAAAAAAVSAAVEAAAAAAAAKKGNTAKTGSSSSSSSTSLTMVTPTKCGPSVEAGSVTDQQVRGVKRKAEPLNYRALYDPLLPDHMQSDEYKMKIKQQRLVSPRSQLTSMEHSAVDIASNLSEDSSSPSSPALPEIPPPNPGTSSSFAGMKLMSQMPMDFPRLGSSEESSGKLHKTKKKKKKNKHKHKRSRKKTSPKMEKWSDCRDKERSDRSYYDSPGSNSPGTQPTSSPEFQVI